MKWEGDRYSTTCMIFTEEGVKGSVTIFFPEHSDEELPEVDYDSETLAGTGSLKDIMAAVRLTKAAMQKFSEEISWTGSFCFYAENRDGFGKLRSKIFKRYLPELQNMGEYNG